jgi:molybdopterin synthase catalytic subunit/molybdopterin converting factor small subunit
MRVRVIPFGILKDWLGAAPAMVELRDGASVSDLLDRLHADSPAAVLRGIAVSVNLEYAAAAQVLREGDEVGLLPPVSGGTASTDAVPARGDCEDAADEQADAALTREPIHSEKLIAAAKCGADGAVVVFDGIVRNHSRGRTTLHLDYEAYEEMALRQMKELCAEARRRFGVRLAAMIHRLGRIAIGETSVLIVVASAHRAQAFEACRWLIDTLKQTVPVWKKETFVDGVVWAAGEPFPEGLAVEAIEPVRSRVSESRSGEPEVLGTGGVE